MTIVGPVSSPAIIGPWTIVLSLRNLFPIIKKGDPHENPISPYSSKSCSSSCSSSRLTPIFNTNRTICNRDDATSVQAPYQCGTSIFISLRKIFQDFMIMSIDKEKGSRSPLSKFSPQFHLFLPFVQASLACDLGRILRLYNLPGHPAIDLRNIRMIVIRFLIQVYHSPSFLILSIKPRTTSPTINSIIPLDIC